MAPLGEDILFETVDRYGYGKAACACGHSPVLAVDTQAMFKLMRTSKLLAA